MNAKEKQQIKILFVGEGTWKWMVTALYKAAKSIEKIEATLFDTSLDGNAIDETRLTNQIQYHFAIGPTIYMINRRLINHIMNVNYDIIFLYNCRTLFSKTIQKIKMTGVYIAMYNNDDPFSPMYRPWFWRHYKASIKYSDIVYCFREHNLADSYSKGVKEASLLRGYYSKNVIFPIETKINVPPVVFIGHIEDDGRIESIKAIANAGICIGLPASECRKHQINHPNITQIENTHENYCAIIGSALIAICFLSSYNRDTYTIRSFEIPATKTLQISQYTDDLAKMFEDGKEIVFFRNNTELVEKCNYFLIHDRERERIARGGYLRVMNDGHEAADRVVQIINDYKRIVGLMDTESV